MHFDLLTNATLNPVKLYESDGEEMPERLTESDSDFEQVISRTRNVPNRVKAVEAAAEANPVDAQEKRANRLDTLQNQAVAPLAPHRVVA